MEQNMFIRILNSEMELATGCTEPGAVALTAAEAGQALRKAGVDKAEEITVNASINIIKNAMSAGIPGTDYEVWTMPPPSVRWAATRSICWKS